MVGPIRDLGDLALKGADLGFHCLDCERHRTIPIRRALQLFHNRGWPTHWSGAEKHFKCGECGSKRVRLSADFYGASLKRQQFRRSLTVVRGGRTCPLGVDPEAWEKADARERKRLIAEARNR